MDDHRFDTLAKSLAQRRSRREIVRGFGKSLAIALGIGGTVGTIAWSDAGARSCSAGGVGCRNDGSCCSGVCLDTGSARRRQCACETGTTTCGNRCCSDTEICVDGRCRQSTQTPTDVPTASNTPLVSSTATNTATNSPIVSTNTPTNTPTRTTTPTTTATRTRTATRTPTRTNTPTNTPTRTATPTRTSTATRTPTTTPTSTPTLPGGCPQGYEAVNGACFQIGFQSGAQCFVCDQGCECVPVNFDGNPRVFCGTRTGQLCAGSGHNQCGSGTGQVCTGGVTGSCIVPCSA
jgi:hypothetical protein